MREIAKKVDPKSAAIVSAATAAVCFLTCEMGNLTAMATGGDTNSCVATTVQHAIPGVLAISLLTAVADPQKALEVAIRVGATAKNAVQEIGEAPVVKNAMGRVGGIFQKKKAAPSREANADADATANDAKKPKAQ